MGNLKISLSKARNERIFELFCYFKKADELIKRGKSPIPRAIKPGGRFIPHSGPGDPLTASYLSFVEPNAGAFDLFLNCRFRGVSGVRHSPDIVLRKSNAGSILSVYECKNHSWTLGLSYYREFIGYLREMKIEGQRARLYRDLYPEMRPCIYTSAIASLSHSGIAGRYDFVVVDRL